MTCIFTDDEDMILDSIWTIIYIADNDDDNIFIIDMANRDNLL